MRPDLVLFDCDGVLVDSEAITTEVLRGDLAARGLPLASGDIDTLFVGGTMQGVMHTARAMGADLPDDWLDHIYPEIFAQLDSACETVPGIVPVLDALDAAGIGYGVGSNGPMAKMQVTLKRCGLWGRMEGRVFSAHDCAAAKPAPDVYLWAAGAMGVPPARCAVVEDSATGARAGAAAGMSVYGFDPGGGARGLSAHCRAVFRAMDDLPGLLGL